MLRLMITYEKLPTWINYEESKLYASFPLEKDFQLNCWFFHILSLCIKWRLRIQFSNTNALILLHLPLNFLKPTIQLLLLLLLLLLIIIAHYYYQ